MSEPLQHVNTSALLKMYRDTMYSGRVLAPRGQEIREIEDLQISISPMFPFNPFVARNYNIDYFRTEMRWKLGANKYDTSIMAHAKMWASVINPDGSFNSNYGVYWFGKQQGFMTAFLELVRDNDSRRAVIPMLSKDHMSPETNDTVCTETVGFRIRDGELSMSAHMRSSDQIFGLGTDIPTFSFLYWLMFGMLQSQGIELSIGKVTITAMSSHIYSRHYQMVESILDNPVIINHEIAMPSCSGPEALAIIASRGQIDQLQQPSILAEWLFA